MHFINFYLYQVWQVFSSLSWSKWADNIIYAYFLCNSVVERFLVRKCSCHGLLLKSLVVYALYTATLIRASELSPAWKKEWIWSWQLWLKSSWLLTSKNKFRSSQLLCRTKLFLAWNGKALSTAPKSFN